MECHLLLLQHLHGLLLLRYRLLQGCCLLVGLLMRGPLLLRCLLLLLCELLRLLPHLLLRQNALRLLRRCCAGPLGVVGGCCLLLLRSRLLLLLVLKRGAPVIAAVSPELSSLSCTLLKLDACDRCFSEDFRVVAVPEPAMRRPPPTSSVVRAGVGRLRSELPATPRGARPRAGRHGALPTAWAAGAAATGPPPAVWEGWQPVGGKAVVGAANTAGAVVGAANTAGVGA